MYTVWCENLSVFMRFDRLTKSYEKVLLSLYNRLGLEDAGLAAPAFRASRKLLGSNWRSLPNVREFRVEVQENNSLFDILGLEKRNRPKIMWKPHKNGQFNRYATKQLLRLQKLRKTNPQRFFAISFLLLRKSWVFRTMAMNHVFPNWHRTMSFSYVLKLNRRVNKLLDTKSTDLQYKRVYIPKANGKFRPLGVPKKEWRLYLHMVNNMLQWFLQPYFLESMHGYQPNKGVLTAWQDFFEKGIDKAKFIYEFDLTNFFPSVRHIYLRSILEDLHVPNWFIRWAITMNKRVPTLPSVEKVDESQFKNRPSPLELKGNTWFETVSEKDAQLRMVLYKDGKYVIPHPNTGKFKEANERRLRMGDEYGPISFNQGTNNMHRTHIGVGQGTPTGPLLSTICLKKFLSQQPSLSYADDGIFYGDSCFTVKDEKHWGIILNESKSGWVKKDGEWIKPLKFLGLEYDGETLKACTRNGSTLELGEGMSAWIQALDKVELKAEHVGKPISAKRTSTLEGYYTWENIMKSKYIGYLQSRLFHGKWNIRDLHQDFTYNYGEHSWCAMTKWRYYLNDLNVFNSSTFASYSLISILQRTFRGALGPKYVFKDDGRVRYVLTLPKKYKEQSKY